RLGPPFRGDERREGSARPHTYSIVKQRKLQRPQFWSGLGFARLFSHPPKSEGVWRARADARRRNAPVQRATGFSRFRVPWCPDQAEPLVAGGWLGGPPGGAAATHTRGCRPRPTFTTPREDALDGRNARNLG